MTKEQFSKLKIGDSVYLRNRHKKDTFTSTQVIDIDRQFGKIKVVLESRFLSYRVYPMTVEHSKITAFVGTYYAGTN